MWSPQSCLLLVTAVVSAPAPAGQAGHAEEVPRQPSVLAGSPHPAVKRSARVNSFLDIPATGFTCQAQDSPGIYADQETGCQVFHYCQHGGRVDSFFCPNLTLFNQQYFVCDWEYNVDCSSAHRYFSINRDVFATLSSSSPTIPIIPSQVDLQGSASEVSRSLNNLASKLATGSTLVSDQAHQLTQVVGTQQQHLTPQAGGLRIGGVPGALSNRIVSNHLGGPDQAVRLGKGLNSYSPLAPSQSTLPLSTPLQTYPVSSASSDPYDDAVSDPEPYPGAVSGDPQATGVSPYSAPAPSYSPTDVTSPRYLLSSSNDPYDDAVADPEPNTGPYSPTSPVAPASPVFSTFAKPTNYLQIDAAAAAYDDAVADPEPYSGATSGTKSAVAQPSSFYSASSPDLSYTVKSSTYPNALIPTPIGASTSGQSYSPVPTPAYDSADPEPYAQSYSDPSYDSADPEPSTYYGSNTIDLSSIDYDDSPGDPEPDPTSYSAPALGAYTGDSGSTLGTYTDVSGGDPGTDSADPEPQPVPESLA